MWHEFCDWYLEIVKPRLQAGDRVARETLATVLDQLLRLLHPFAPFLTEELWQHLKTRARKAGLQAADAMASDAIICAAWPASAPEHRDLDAEEQMRLLQEIVRAVRNVKKEKGISERQPVNVTIATADEATDAVIESRRGLLRQMAVLGEVEHGVAMAKPPLCATTVVGSLELFLLLEGLVDIDAERRRLEKQRADVERRVDALNKTLHNDRFLANTPEQVVQQKRDSAEELRDQLTKIIQNLADLG